MLKQSNGKFKMHKKLASNRKCIRTFVSVSIVLVLGDTLVKPQLFVSFSISCICEQSLTDNAYRHFSQNELSSPNAANFCPRFFWLRFSFLCYFFYWYRSIR